MAQEGSKKNIQEEPAAKGKEAGGGKKLGVEDGGISENKENFATAVLNTVGEIFNSRDERIKKASKEMGKYRFGTNMLGAGIFLALAGTVGITFWGMKAILEADKHFMTALKFFS